MPAPLDPAVELLERALGYTRLALTQVDDADLTRPTPCDGWDLRTLLTHMDDALDAFAEAASGRVAQVAVRSAPSGGPGSTGSVGPAGPRVATLQRKACALLGTWSARLPDLHPDPVRVGSRALPSSVLVSGAALEVAVHGWDVAQATGARTRLPPALAGRLLPVARALVTDDDRGVRFDPPVLPPIAGDVGDVLLAFLGRHEDHAGRRVPA